MKLYAGNLSYETNENELRQMFEAHGQVDSAVVITDKFSGESKGFGFVEMPDGNAAKAAIEALNGKEIKGRRIVVNEARPQGDRGPRGGGGGGGGGRPYGGGGGGGGGGRRRY